VPVVAGATAGAIGGMADSGLVVRLTRGRLWIGALGVLLVGIVALNVMALSFNASSSKVAAQTDALKRANSALQARLSGELSREQVIAAAGRLGLFLPEPVGVRELSPSPGDAAAAARRLRSGELTLIDVLAPVAPVAPVSTETTAPAAVAPTEPLEAPAPVTDPAATAPPVTTDPAAGGVVAP
jgi:hypothetical protein